MLGYRIRTCALFAILTSLVSTVPIKQNTNTDPQITVQQAEAIYHDNTMALFQRINTSCTQSNLNIRRAWDDLSHDERISYINAVQCMSQLPPETSLSLVPGVRSRLDDFTYAHIIETNYVHISGLLLPWHRQFIWSFEQALRSECNYTGSLPYWAWERHSDDQTQSPIFQPGLDSFGTNGLPIPNRPAIQNKYSVNLDPPITLTRETGLGGGCITDGAFANLSTNLGPVGPDNAPNNTYGTLYNPRCISRDLNPSTSSQNLTYTTIADLYETPDIHHFHPLLEAVAHPNSHDFLGGSSADFYASPQEPLFYLLHAQIDRIWTVWQMQDWESRKEGLDGTVTIANNPPSENATVDTVMRMRTAGGDVKIGIAMDPLGGEYCYMYA